MTICNTIYNVCNCTFAHARVVLTATIREKLTAHNGSIIVTIQCATSVPWGQKVHLKVGCHKNFVPCCPQNECKYILGARMNAIFITTF